MPGVMAARSSFVLFTPGAMRARVLDGGVKKGDQGRLGLPGQV